MDGPVNKLEDAVEPLEWIKSKYGTYFVTGIFYVFPTKNDRLLA